MRHVLLALFLALPMIMPAQAGSRCAAKSGLDRTFCEQYEATFPGDMANAMKGDYGAQRNVAFCRSTGCDGGVEINTVEGCAWRMIIVASGNRQVDASDRENLEVYCGENHVPDNQLNLAIMRADALFRQIYGRALTR